jgi:anti-sigma B factor antagonist
MHRSPTDGPLRRALRPSGPVQFELSERQQRGATMVHVDGELDILTAPRLGAQLDGIVRKGTGDVVLDLRDAVFMDSAGLHILLTAHRRLTRASRRLAVICVEGPVRRVIELARLIETLGVVSSLQESELRPTGANAVVKSPDGAAPAV